MLSILADEQFLGAIFSTISIILIGYYIRKKNIVGESSGKVVSDIVLSISLPALALRAFMVDLSQETFTTGLNVFIFGFLAHLLLILVGETIFFRERGDRRATLAVLIAFGSTTFFGIPIINGLFGDVGTLYANIFNISYRVFLYSYGLIRMSDLKFDKSSLKLLFANPIVIATFFGLFVWIFQNSLPQLLVDTPKGQMWYAFLRVDKTMPWFYTAVNYLAGLSSPLSWLAIGLVLGNVSLKEAMQDKVVWVYSFIKLFVIPAAFIPVLLVTQWFIPMDYVAVMSCLLMIATPAATVAVAYAIKYEKEPVLASNASLLSTIIAVGAVIFWIIVGSFLKPWF